MGLPFIILRGYASSFCKNLENKEFYQALFAIYFDLIDYHLTHFFKGMLLVEKKLWLKSIVKIHEPLTNCETILQLRVILISYCQRTIFSPNLTFTGVGVGGRTSQQITEINQEYHFRDWYPDRYNRQTHSPLPNYTQGMVWHMK